LHNKKKALPVAAPFFMLRSRVDHVVQLAMPETMAIGARHSLLTSTLEVQQKQHLTVEFLRVF
jgi:hypothetical protein